MNGRAGASNQAHSAKVFFSFRYDEDRYRADALSATLGEQAIWRRHEQIGMPYLLWTH